MPNESRDLYFNKDELKLVVSHYLNLTGHHMAEFTPQNVIIGCEPMRALRIVYIENAASNVGHVDLDAGKLKDALICYCRDQGIPIPQNADKSVQTQGDQIIMTIRRSLTQQVA
ncbi:MAG: hypothetical protein HQ483_00635 [Rhodospirillales bacterium]|nr:hypothetical protein [Rhodospirillales bacterium]